MIQKGQKGTDVEWLQGSLSQLGFPCYVDGDFGGQTELALRQYQASRGLSADGIAGVVTIARIQNETADAKPESHSKKITEQDIGSVAFSSGIQKAAIKAVMKVETQYGTGFLKSGRPIILFEGHIFWWRLAVAGIRPETIQGHPNVVYPKWDSTQYKGWELEWDRLAEARSINENAALESASWGLFQVMGYNWKALGYSGIQDFVAKMEDSEKNQLEAFIKFVQANNLKQYIDWQDWAAFAFHYNGAGYKENKYDEVLANWYSYFSRNPDSPVF